MVMSFGNGHYLVKVVCPKSLVRRPVYPVKGNYPQGFTIRVKVNGEQHENNNVDDDNSNDIRQVT